MRRRVISVGAALMAVPLVLIGALPAHASYTVVMSGLSCPNNQWPPQEIHIKSLARGSVTHTSYSEIHGIFSVSAGSSPAYFDADTHHWLRYEVYGAAVTTSLNTTADIASADRYCT